jgi:hypothetical protein
MSLTPFESYLIISLMEPRKTHEFSKFPLRAESRVFQRDFSLTSSFANPCGLLAVRACLGDFPIIQAKFGV